jgi:hypothetical protein
LNYDQWTTSDFSKQIYLATPFVCSTTKECKINFKNAEKRYDSEANTNVCVCDGSRSTIDAQPHQPRPWLGLTRQPVEELVPPVGGGAHPAGCCARTPELVPDSLSSAWWGAGKPGRPSSTSTGKTVASANVQDRSTTSLSSSCSPGRSTTCSPSTARRTPAMSNSEASARSSRSRGSARRRLSTAPTCRLLCSWACFPPTGTR